MSKGYIHSCGWGEVDGLGEVFRAIVIYPDGPPLDLKYDLCWDRSSVEIVPTPPQEKAND